jgi:hypothetical protein
MLTPRLAAVAAAILVAAPPAFACTFCGESLRSKPTLRLHYSAAKVVVYGQLRNPRFDPATDIGFTDMHVTAVLKDDAFRNGQVVLTLREYLPVIGNTPPDYVVYFREEGGKLVKSHGLAAPARTVEYIKAAAVLPADDPVKRLAFFFRHLDSTDPAVAADAFHEFARAPDADILKAAGELKPAVVRRLIADLNTPPERLGVFAFLLGACGGPADAAFLAELLRPNPLPERTESAFGGLLAGYILLSPRDGWAYAAAVLGDEKRPYSQRLSAINTVRFFQASRGRTCRAEVLRCCAALLPHGDLADQAVEDLRRWGWWDLTADVLGLWGKPSHTAPVVRRGLVRYAITCPKPEAKAFFEAARRADPKLVKEVEDRMSLFEPVNPGK